MKKILLPILLLGWGVLITACGTTSIQNVQMEKASKEFSGAYVKCGESEEEKYLQEEIQALLESDGIYKEDLFIDCRILFYDEGNRALRYFVGFGAGAATSTIKVNLFNRNKENIGSFETSSQLSAGVFGGGAKNVLDSDAKSIVQYIKKHYIILNP